jgi:uncharacterized protein YlxP (DUF503 family)
MHVGTLSVVLKLGEGNSLKDKRRVVRSLIDTARRRFNVSIAEVDDQDLLRTATIGVATVSNDSAHANSVLSKVLEFIQSHPELDVYDVAMEFLAV